jgi:hypothetical protein
VCLCVCLMFWLGLVVVLAGFVGSLWGVIDYLCKLLM